MQGRQRYPFAEVTWVDAQADPTYDGSPDGAGGLVVLRRVCFILGVRRDERAKMDYLVGVHEVNDDLTGVRDVISIPLGWVLDIKPLTYGPRSSRLKQQLLKRRGR